MNNFITAIWYQRKETFTKWAGRGINTIWGFTDDGGPTDYTLWKAAAVSAGVKYAVQWSGGRLSAADNSDPNLVAVLQVDEPDGVSATTPGKIIDTYNTIKAALPDKPVVVNLDGRAIPYRPFSDYKCYAYGGDWLSMDNHVINWGLGPAGIPVIGQNLDVVVQAGKAAGGAKKYLCVLECADQDLRISNYGKLYPNIAALMRGPTSGEMALEVNQVIAKPMSGVIWFADGIGAGFENFDNMNADQVSAMITLNTMLRNR